MGGESIHIKLIWEKMKIGDEAALSEIFTCFYSDLYRYGIKIFNHPDLVRDSIQDVFVRIWERRDTVGDVQNAKAYLITSLRRKLFENKAEYASKIYEGKSGEDEKETFSFSSAEFMEVEEISAQLRTSMTEAINGLPERQRELIYLRFYFNLPYAEIARIMDVKEQTIKNLMQRTIANLRSKIDRQLWDGIDNMDDLMMTLFLLFGKKEDR
jgi:RNA polymerase sigma-70 factor (ECF subfamily)